MLALSIGLWCRECLGVAGAYSTFSHSSYLMSILSCASSMCSLRCTVAKHSPAVAKGYKIESRQHCHSSTLYCRRHSHCRLLVGSIGLPGRECICCQMSLISQVFAMFACLSCCIKHASNRYSSCFCGCYCCCAPDSVAAFSPCCCCKEHKPIL